MHYVLFSDAKAKKFTSPALEPGVIIEYIYTLVTESAPLWGEVQFQRTVPVLSARFTLDVPAGMVFDFGVDCPDYLPQAFHKMTRDLSAFLKPGRYLETSPLKQARRTYQCALSDLPAIPLETYMPPLSAAGMRLTYSSASFLDQALFGNFASLGNWYAQLIADRLQASASIQQKARELTQHLNTTEEKVKTIYRFLQEHFRYVAVALGTGRIIPELPSVVDTNRYGDCKGLSALMIAMLRSIGVHAYPVVLKTQDEGNLDEKYVAFSQFNHMIVCVEDAGKTLWVDPTASHCAFASLPWQDQGVRALVIKPDGSDLATTPTSGAQANGRQTAWNVTLDAQGSFTARVQAQFTGQEGVFFREVLGQVKAEKQPDVVFHRQLPPPFQHAQVMGYRCDNLNQADEPLTISYQFEAPHGLQKVGNLRVLPLPFRAEIPAFPPKKRVHRIRFEYPFHQVDEMTIHLPVGYTVEELPSPVDFKTVFGQLKLQVTQGQSLVTVRSDVIFNATSLPATEYESLCQFQQQWVAIGQKTLLLKRGVGGFRIKR